MYQNGRQSLIRHEVVVREEGDEIDLDEDPLGEMFDMLEKKPRATAAWLQERDYDLAREGTQFLKRISLFSNSLR